MPLRNRQLQIPGGLRYIQSDTGWASSRWASFSTIVDEVIAHRLGNPHLITTNGWSTDRKTVENEVDAFNSAICKAMNWTEFFTEEGAVAGAQSGPFPQGHPRLLHSAKNVAAGSTILVEWIASGAEAVPIAQATKRAAICCGQGSGQGRCPKNVSSDLTSIFTIPVANAIRSELKRRKDLDLKTPYDDSLGVCSACSCPMKLKVHVPLNSFLHKMSKEAVDDLDPRCWILAERDGREPVITEIEKVQANVPKL